MKEEVSSARVVIGVPTHNRPELLRRALNCIAKQDYSNIKVLVSDNSSPESKTEETVVCFREKIHNLEYNRHSNNVGALRNFFWLLDNADGDYFMWLADDDEISPNYVSSLVKVLDSDRSISTAVGHWVLVKEGGMSVSMNSSSFPQSNALLRCVRYVWYSDDAFFYGLHRMEMLKKAKFTRYCWPNQAVLINWAYVFLFDMVTQGRVVVTDDPTAQFVNHDYTEKKYIPLRKRRIPVLPFVIRRLNVHYLYLAKACKSLGALSVFLLAPISLASLVREGFSMLFQRSLLQITEILPRRIV